MEIPCSSSPIHFRDKPLSGRNRRLLYEWQTIVDGLAGHSDICCQIMRTNADGLPIVYCIDYQIQSICSVSDMDHLNQPGITNSPIMADRFRMLIELPDNYPCVDGAPIFRFLTEDENGRPIPHPWHPNIRYFGAFAGRVCLNRTDTYTDLLWGIQRVASYLRYERYHALSEPPYPEDMQVAAWVVRQAESNDWLNWQETEQMTK